MMCEDLFRRAKITSDGAISLGGVLVCDGYEKGHKAAAFTHIHHDHMGNNFGTCMHNYPVYVSKITGDLLKAITDDNYFYRTQLHIIDYEEPQCIPAGGHANYLTLLESSHVLGASQILLQTNDGSVLYSGDISPNDRPRKCDVLVIDSTHGSLRFNKHVDGGSLERRLVDAVLDSLLNKKKSVCVHAHRGKLQHLMSLLSCHRDIPSDVKFLSEKIDNRVASVYCKYGEQIRNIVPLNSYEGDEITCSDYPWIEFRPTMDRTLKEKNQSITRVTVSGSIGEVTIRQNDKELWIASDEHAELDGILKYVKDADPCAVITDNSCRTNNGTTLAEIIQTKLKIPSKALP